MRRPERLLLARKRAAVERLRLVVLALILAEQVRRPRQIVHRTSSVVRMRRPVRLLITRERARYSGSASSYLPCDR